jgi:RIO-like serine/threonine protein kinase
LILGFLAQRPFLAVSQYDIEAGANISRKTVGGRLNELLQWGLVHQPHGKRKGYAVTQNGMEMSQAASMEHGALITR